MFKLDELNGKKIIITGGAGFIGHNLALQIKKLGGEVIVVDSLQVNNLGYYTTHYADNLNSKRYISYINERLRLLKDAGVIMKINDVREYHAISNIIDEYKPDVIVHLAAVSHANRSNKDPYSTFDHSMHTLENALDGSKKHKPHFIFFSSSMVYGNFGNEPAHEDRECKPMGIYGALKYGAEKLVIAYNQVFNIPYTIIRPSALYGERCVSRRVGQAFIENGLVLPSGPLRESLKNLKKYDGIFLNGNGEEGLDFTYIDDLIQGILKCIGNPRALNEVFNITYGEARSLNNLAEQVIKKFPNIKIVHKDRDALMPERGTLDISKAKELLDYQPHFPVEAGFENYINWNIEFAKRNTDLFNE